MFARYNGHLYKLIKDGKSWELVSKSPKSVDNGFIKDGNIFYKSIDNLDLLEEICDIELFVEYDAHLENVKTKWKLSFTNDFYKNDTIKLLFGEGILPNWTVEDKNVCSKYVSINEVLGAYLLVTDKRTGKQTKENVDITRLNEVFNEMMNL